MVRILMKQTLSTNFEVTNSDFSIKCVRFFAIVKDRIETKNKFLEKISENLSFVVSELVAGSSEQDILFVFCLFAIILSTFRLFKGQQYLNNMLINI